MHPLIRILIRAAIILFVIVAAIQPFNWFCQITQACRPFYFSYYMPKRQGSLAINLEFATTSYNEDIVLSQEEPAMMTVGNKKNIVTYYIKNNSRKIFHFQPKLFVEPEFAAKYLIRYECPCFRKYKLKPGEEIRLKMEFEIDRAIESNREFTSSDKRIKIRFKI